MSRSRRLLLLSLLASSTALGHPARAEISSETAYPEVGGWGQAWGEDEMPARPAERQRPRPIAPLPANLSPLPSAPPPSAMTAPPASALVPLDEAGAQSYPEVGGWGQAWGEDDVPAPPRPPQRPAAMPSTLAAPTPAPAAASGQPRLRASVSPEMVQDASSADPAAPRRAARISMAPAEIDGDAVGMRRPPRIVPRAIDKMRRREEGDAPSVHMEADQVIYDREYNIVTAKGRVEMIQSDRTITADTVTYNLKQDVMGASGNVVMTEPTGEVTFADYFEITGDFKSGVAANLRMILADNSRLAAQSGQRVGGDRTDFDRAVYTACEPCRDDPGRTPIWQAKAQRITHNQAEAQVEYRDAWIELAGVPVLYTPYMSHPDPTVRRKSGFLAPTFGYNSAFGPSLTTPYFFVLSDQEDITLSPRFMWPPTSSVTSMDDAEGMSTTAMQHLLMQGEHRWRGIYGEAKSTGSITADQTNGNIRGHVESMGIVNLDKTWRAGWQLQHQSDNYYRDIYRIRTENERPWRLTRPYLEGFGRRNYAMAETMSFQGPRVIADTNKSTVVLPHMVHHVISEPGWAGSHWTFDSDVLSYTRTQGTTAQRVSHSSGWHLPMISPDGQVVLLNAKMRGDGYIASHVTGYDGDVTAGRAIPEASATWHYPFARHGAKASQVIEPMAMVAISPMGGNSAKIPNEDSMAFELDETNVMRPNRLVGLDRVEGGLRGGYGLHYNLYPSRGGRLGAQIAQGWRRHLDNTFSSSSGFTDTFSDYLGRIDVEPNANLSLVSRARLDRTTMALRRNESTVSVGPPIFSLSTSYGFLSTTSSTAGQIYPRRQYLTYGVVSNISQYWRAAASLSQDLAEDGGTLSWNANTTYNDECFAIVATMNRYYSNAPGLLSGYNAMLSIVLKTLGEAPVGLF